MCIFVFRTDTQIASFLNRSINKYREGRGTGDGRGDIGGGRGGIMGNRREEWEFRKRLEGEMSCFIPFQATSELPNNMIITGNIF